MHSQWPGPCPPSWHHKGPLISSTLLFLLLFSFNASCCPCQQASAVVRTVILCLAESRAALAFASLSLTSSPAPCCPPPPSSLPLSLSIHSSLFPSAKCVKVPFIPTSWSGGIVMFKKVVWWCTGVPSRCAATAERPGRLQSVSQDSSSSKARGKTIHATTHQSLVLNHLSTLGRPSPVV